MGDVDRDLTRWELKLFLMRRGLKQWRVAKAMGKDPAWISKVVNGAIDPGDEDRARFAAVLDLKPEETKRMFSATKNAVA